MADPQDPFRQGLSFAARIGVELVVSTVVGAGLGYLLDTWLGTRPWIMVVGVFTGGAAGFLTIYRMATSGDQPGDKKER
ncbi:MAG TPA: AtpZ/AtpI family protein [Nitrospiria bacterium]|nr:AtpZ/AtpI family protein [Nitrospiria bacterium]